MSFIKISVIFFGVSLMSISPSIAQEKVDEKEKMVLLNEIIIKQKRERFVLKNDSLLINLHPDDTRPHASAKTLFERVQGLDIGFGGDVKILGKSVQNVTIDGKTIFGGVAALTLDNIRADMIERMEFVQTTNVSGKTQNTLNLKLKENRKHGGYGDLGIGVGSNLLYSTNGNFSKITSKWFFNVFSNANAINEKGIDTKIIDRLLTNNFRNSINRISSVIGLYEPPKESFETELNKLTDGFLGINKVFDNGLNYTFQTPKVEFNGFIYHSLLQEKNTKNTYTKQFLGSNIQSMNEISDKNSTSKSIVANTYLTWNLTSSISLRFSEQINLNNNHSQFLQNNDWYSSQYALQKFNTHNDETFEKQIEHNFQLSGVVKGNRHGIVSSVLYQNLISISNRNIEFENKGEFYKQEQSIKMDNDGLFHNIQITHSLPLRKGILLEGKLKQVIEQRFINQNTQLKGTTVANDNNKLKNQLSEVTIFGLYKKRKLTLVAGISYWYWNIKRLASENSFETKTSFILNTFSRLEYKPSNVKFAIKYAKEPVLPTWRQVISPSDSSNLNAITASSPYLNFYTQEGLDFSVETGVKNGYQIGVQATFKKLNDYIISENIYLPLYGVYSSSFINSKFPTHNLNINFIFFKVNPSNKFTWHFIAGFSQINTFQKTQELFTRINAVSSFINFNVGWRINSSMNFKTQVKSQINTIQKSLQTITNLSSNLTFDIGKKTYFDSQIRFQLYQSKIIFFQSYFDFELGRFILKNNNIKVSMIIKNVLNKKNEITLLQNTNLSSFSYNNYLPFTFLGKVTIYPETWKK
jgi:hypothetical protein